MAAIPVRVLIFRLSTACESRVATSTSLIGFPAVEPRLKVACKPMNEWLASRPEGLVQMPDGVTKEQLRAHKTPETGIWTACKGTVYDITAYCEYHPGGADELMKGAGKDCTSLFNKKHPWVNDKAFLEHYAVGPYKG